MSSSRQNDAAVRIRYLIHQARRIIAFPENLARQYAAYDNLLVARPSQQHIHQMEVEIARPTWRHAIADFNKNKHLIKDIATELQQLNPEVMDPDLHSAIESTLAEIDKTLRHPHYLTLELNPHPALQKKLAAWAKHGKNEDAATVVARFRVVETETLKLALNVLTDFNMGILREIEDLQQQADAKAEQIAEYAHRTTTLTTAMARTTSLEELARLNGQLQTLDAEISQALSPLLSSDRTQSPLAAITFRWGTGCQEMTKIIANLTTGKSSALDQKYFLTERDAFYASEPFAAIQKKLQLYLRAHTIEDAQALSPNIANLMAIQYQFSNTSYASLKTKLERQRDEATTQSREMMRVANADLPLSRLELSQKIIQHPGDIAAAILLFNQLESKQNRFTPLCQKAAEYSADIANMNPHYVTLDVQNVLKLNLTVYQEKLALQELEEKKAIDSLYTQTNPQIQASASAIQDSIMKQVVNEAQQLAAEDKLFQTLQHDFNPLDVKEDEKIDAVTLKNLQHQQQAFSALQDKIKKMQARLEQSFAEFKKWRQFLQDRTVHTAAIDTLIATTTAQLSKYASTLQNLETKKAEIQSALQRQTGALLEQTEQRVSSMEAGQKYVQHLMEEHYYRQDDAMLASPQWQAVATVSKDQLKEIAQLKQTLASLSIPNGTNMSFSQNRLEKKMNALEKKLAPIVQNEAVIPPPARVQAAQKAPFTGLKNLTLIRLMLKNNIHMNPAATLHDLIAVNDTIHQPVSNQELQRRLAEVGIKFPSPRKYTLGRLTHEVEPPEIELINQMNKQLRYRHLIANKALAYLVGKKNIMLKSTEFFSNTHEQIAKINQAMQQPIHDREMQNLLATVGIKDITPIELKRIQRINQQKYILTLHHAAKKLVRPEQMKEATVIDKNLQKKIELIATTVKAKMIDIDSAQYTSHTLFQKKPAELQLIHTQLQNIYASSSNLMEEISRMDLSRLDVIYLQRNCAHLQRAVEDKLWLVENALKIQGKLVITTDPHHLSNAVANPAHIAYQAQHRVKALEPLEFFQLDKATLSYDVLEKRVGPKNRQLQKIIAHQLSSPEGAPEIQKIMQRNAQNKLPDIYIFGPPDIAMEMAKNILLERGPMQLQELKINVNHEWVDVVALAQPKPVGFTLFREPAVEPANQFTVQSADRVVEDILARSANRFSRDREGG